MSSVTRASERRATPGARAKGLSKSFGGLHAVRDVTLQDHAGRPQGHHRPERRRQDHAVQPDHRHLSGSRRARCCCSARTSPTGRATGAPRSAWRARSRSPACSRELTVLDNVLLAIKGVRPSKFVMWRFLSSYRDVYDKAHSLLEQAAFLDRKDTEVRYLSHGEQRQLEIVLGLASDPKILLLDEPAAGLSSGESAEMAKFLMRLDPESRDPADRARHGRGVRRRGADFGAAFRRGAGDRRAGADQAEPEGPGNLSGDRADHGDPGSPGHPHLLRRRLRAAGPVAEARAGPDPRPARAQRRRQDHAGEFDRRLHPAAPRTDRVQGRRHHRHLLVRDRPQRHGAGAAGPARVSDAERRGEPAGGRAQHRPPRLESRPRLRPVSRACRSGATSAPRRCRAASSRCWRSAAG